MSAGERSGSDRAGETPTHTTLPEMQPGGVPLLGNDWSVLSGQTPDEPPRVSVIVAHFDQQRQLDRTLAALARQTHPADRTQIIVVDDGSPIIPRVPPGVLLLRQDDRGFRLAAARNLGARHATGDVLCFLDADTAPEPGYLSALTRMPACAPDVLAVGRRRHADLSSTGPELPVEVAALSLELPEPAWLREAYTDSANLLHSDDRSYRFVIGAVIACSRTLFDATGGFDETFTEYGGEDWEWAHRAWLAGAAFAHVPAAVAWHDGPEWAGRADDPARRTRKNAETLALARRIPVAGSRAPALWMHGAVALHGPSAPGSPPPSASGEGASPRMVADIVVRVHTADSLAALIVAVDSILGALPEALVAVPPLYADALARDARLIPLNQPVLSRLDVDVPQPVRFDAAELRRAVERVTDDQLGSLELIAAELASAELASAKLATTVPPSTEGAPERVALITSQRAKARALRWNRDDLFDHARQPAAASKTIDDEPDLAAYFGGWG